MLNWCSYQHCHSWAKSLIYTNNKKKTHTRTIHIGLIWGKGMKQKCTHADHKHLDDPLPYITLYMIVFTDYGKKVKGLLNACCLYIHGYFSFLFVFWLPYFCHLYLLINKHDDSTQSTTRVWLYPVYTHVWLYPGMWFYQSTHECDFTQSTHMCDFTSLHTCVTLSRHVILPVYVWHYPVYTLYNFTKSIHLFDSIKSTHVCVTTHTSSIKYLASSPI